jgi:Tripartite tricarboxylate transporter TctB family
VTSASAHEGAPTAPGGSTAAGAAGAVAPGDSVASLEAAVHQVEHEAEHRPPPAGPVTNVVIAVLVLALGAACLVGSWALGIGTASAPGSGTWPFVISVVLVVLAVALVLTARRTHDAERFTGASWLVVAGLATMVGFVVAIPRIGFEVPSALLMFVWLRFMGGESWRLSALLSPAVVAVFYLIFVVALSVPIPHLF